MAFGSVNVPGKLSAADVGAAAADHTHPAQTTVTGNAGTATKLATARKIGSASFDGSADITLAQIGAAAASHTHAAQTTVSGNAGTATKLATARKIGSASFDGSADITLAQIGAAAADHTHTAQTTVTGNAGTATKLATARAIDGMSFDGSAAVVHYATCSTAATTAAKTVTLTGFSLVTGARIAVKFTNHTEAANPTLNVNGTGAKPIYYANGKVGRSGLWGAGEIVEFIYDGTNWLLVNPAFVEGPNTASGEDSHAEGWKNTASGNNSHAEGCKTTASGESSHSEGNGTTASGLNSHAGGFQTTASGYHSFTSGYQTIASAYYQTAVGSANVECSDGWEGLFIVGKGNYNSTTQGIDRANALRVKSNGVAAAGSYASTGADYAELFEWEDGNPDKEDRAGRFVTLDGEKIRLAGPGDDFILGIISGNPSVVGDVHDDQWQGMFLYDIYGRPIWEDVEVPEQTEEVPDPEDPEKTIPRVIVPAHVEHRQKINPDYDSGQKYIPRTERPEWGCVGMMGKLVVIDDGTCEVNGWCKPGEGGVATVSAERTDFRVMARIDATHVRVLMLGRR